MREDKQRERRDQIEAAAYALLAEKGFAGTSMLAIAKRARCSNETLYNWYGDKLGLMRAMVARNAAAARALLVAAPAQGETLAETLDVFGPRLLSILLSDRAVTLNRAAAADVSGALGGEIAASGREAILPLLEAVFLRARTQEGLVIDDPAAAVDLYLSLLIGDQQIRRVIGRLPEPSARAQAKRATAARERLLKLLK
ncbi:transcriptional repressor BetI [Tritonibacter multivorans]|uniref:Transcriptional repressor BetI n=1 Tax=Tritonibacter multivorans TaxID=928856 RepID=A0A0P1GJG6_9RHOB|nr:TetR/AcrR family transcriptional regulator [Tritonibacter multivorans]MDA7422839.1 TetR/AcrR family transcriptional regulator [Tritonibacter multivorans]CUH76255.1 transcriptional repressor BetI [Tritonibacter multivorans]SFD61613.1 transcriptional regulator, TetR family [Tritonibacter multivorans]